MTRVVRLVAIVTLLAVASDARAGVAFFDDLTDSIEVSGQTVFGTAATYEAIVLYPTAHNSGSTIFNEWQAFAEDKYFAVTPGAMGALYGYDHPVGIGAILVGPAAVTLDQWHHVAYVYDGSEERLYLDGTLVQSRSVSGDIGDSVGLGYVGAIHRDGAPRDGFVGLIDVLRLSDVARYAGASFTPPSPNMVSDANTVLLYAFDDAPGSTTVADASSLGRTGTLGGGFWNPTSPILCGDDPTDADGDFIPDSCDPDPPTTTTTTITPTTTTTTTTTTPTTAPTTTTLTTTTTPTTTTTTTLTTTTPPTTASTTTTTMPTTTTTVVGGSTTTTTLPEGCGGAFVEPTFTSIRCAVAALLAQTQGDTRLGKFQPKLVHSLEVARSRTDDAVTSCGASNLKTARKRLQQAGKALAQYRHRLDSRAARKRLDPTLRMELQDDAGGIRDAAGALHRTMRCPDDAS